MAASSDHFIPHMSIASANGIAISMKLARAVQLSFDVACPNSAAMPNILRKATARLALLQPKFVGINGGMALPPKRRDAVRRITQEFNVEVMAVVDPRDVAAAGVDTCAQCLLEMGATRVLLAPARRVGGTSFRNEAPDTDGKRLESLVDDLVGLGLFSVGISACPERHSDPGEAMVTIDKLKPAIDAGAMSVFAEVYFDNDAFLAFDERMRARGIDVPLVPSLRPIVDFQRTVDAARAQGVSVPRFVRDFFSGLELDKETQRMVSAEFLANQIKSLISRGVHEFHIAALCQPDLVYGACRMSGWNNALLDQHAD